MLLSSLWPLDTTNPLPVTWWLIGCSICYWTYFTQLFLHIPEYVLSHIGINVFSCMFFFILLLLPFSDPGYIKTSPENDQILFLDCLECKEQAPEICVTCFTHRPIRSKHYANAPELKSGQYIESLLYYYDTHRMISIFIIYGFLAWVWILKLLGAQVLGIMFNYTINEVVNMTRYTYLRKNGKWNVFHTGVFGNIKEFLFHSKKWYSTFHI
eukprot:gene2346-2894_t